MNWQHDSDNIWPKIQSNQPWNHLSYPAIKKHRTWNQHYCNSLTVTHFSTPSVQQRSPQHQYISKAPPKVPKLQHHSSHNLKAPLPEHYQQQSLHSPATAYSLDSSTHTWQQQPPTHILGPHCKPTNKNTTEICAFSACKQCH